jgi:3-hydroxyisobutyrate dehydrogenase-like beta-hydroxyacid dehydrogenase
VLAEQQDGGHCSIHDDAMAGKAVGTPVLQAGASQGEGPDELPTSVRLAVPGLQQGRGGRFVEEVFRLQRTQQLPTGTPGNIGGVLRSLQRLEAARSGRRERVSRRLANHAHAKRSVRVAAWRASVAAGAEHGPYKERLFMKQAIGMAGIGLMGHGIAGNIVRHGYPLSLLEHAGNQPLDDLKAAGAVGVRSASELAARSDVVILVLTGSPQVEAVLAGPGGVLEGLRPGSVVIDCSTSIPSSTLRMAQAVQAIGGRFLDAPMTRTPKEAAEGRLNLLVGGEAALLDECLPLLRCFAENITHAGPVAAGHGMKLLHNYVSLGTVALISEAAACARRNGVSAEVFVEVLAKGGGGGTALERLKPYLLTGDPSGLKFSVANASKDLGYYHAMASDAGAASGIAAAVLATLQGALQHCEPGTFVSELPSLLGPRAA